MVCLNQITKCKTSNDWSNDQYPSKWFHNAKDNINKILNRKLNKNLAKNVILFLGDGKRKKNLFEKFNS